MAPRPTEVRVWVLSNGKPKPVMIGYGLEDQQYMEVTSGDLKEGDQVIIAATGGAQSNQQQNPFGPRFPGGGRRF